MALGAWFLIAGAGCSWEWTVGLLLCILAYDLIHKKTAWGIVLMGGCRSLLWITAGTAASGMSPAPLLYVWAIAVGAYVVGISWYARTESKTSEDKEAKETLLDRLPILFLFIVPLISLAYLVLWNNLDPVRVFLVNLTGFFAGGIVFLRFFKCVKTRRGRLEKAYPGYSQASVRWMPPPFRFMLPCWLDRVSSLEQLPISYKRSLRQLERFLDYLLVMPNTYSSIRRNVRLDLSHEVFFTRDAFEMDNSTLADLLKGDKPGKRTKAIVYLDEGILDGNPNLPKLISDYFAANQSSLDLVCAPGFVRGGEEAKNDWNLVEVIWSDLNKYGMCRHSYVIVVGGGAALDLVGFAASTAHRGVRLVRFPTTTLSQGDGGVGVKNGINFFGKKNWVGTFAVPEAVVNDFSFLRTLPDNQKRAGYVEAIKVALIRDRAFFEWIEGRAHELAKFMAQPMEQLIRRSAALHLDHIAGSGDPFERGSARPLDFGHWIAHKLEPMSGFEVGHGDAVAIGLAADVVYCARVGLLKEEAAERVLGLLESLGFEIYHPLLHAKNEQGGSIILNGLEEFREHLGGKLTITLIQALGQGVEVHQMDDEQVLFAIDNLRSRSLAHTQA